MLSKALILLVLLAGLYFLYGVKARATVKMAGSSCTPEYPIAITVHNYTFRRLIRVNLELEGWRNGIGDDILGNDLFTFNKILRPFSSATECFGNQAFAFPEYPGSSSRYSMEKVAYDSNHEMELTRNVEIVVRKITPVFY
jgi:hypothetical protein